MPEPTPGAAPVAIAGIGGLSSVGATAAECFEALLAGTSGLHPLRVYDRELFGTTAAYEIDDRPDGVDVPLRATALLVAAIREAAADAGLADLRGVPVLVGTGLREMRTAELAMLTGAPVEADRLDFARAVREELGAEDVQTFSNACSASLYALGLGLDLIRLGRAETVVAAGVDVLTASMFGLLDRVHLDPPDRVRPFDTGRKGVLIGEGAAAVVLRAGTGGRAQLRSVALGCDAFHVTAPDPAGIEATVRAAHDQAGVQPEAVDLLYAHGTGTVLNDQAEAEALTAVFGTLSGGPAVTAIKALTGHTSGSSGLLSLVMAVLSLESGRVPGIAGLTLPIPQAAGLHLLTGPAELPAPALAQVNAFGFGGLNAVAMVEAS